MMKINNASYLISNAKVQDCPPGQQPEFAFIGRSNVGKSSLINMLTGNRKLALTSQKPGKTLLINHFSINGGEWNIVDLPGYGYAARGKEQRQKIVKIIEDYVLERKQMECLFVLVDIRHKPQQIDLEFMDWLVENDIYFAIVFTKADKIGPRVAEHNVAVYKRVMKKALGWQELPPVFVTSAQTAKGRDELLDFIGAICSEVEEAAQKSRSEE